MFNTVLEGLYASQRHFFSKEKQKNKTFFSPYFIENDSLNQIFKPQLTSTYPIAFVKNRH